jgi:hypothetical protein
MTSPAGTVALLDVLTVPNLRPALVSEEVAADCEDPTTFGTATCAGPLLSVRLTSDPGETLAPAAGFSLMTLPVATVALVASVIVPTFNPAAMRAEVAADWVWPATLGTATCAGPLLSDPPQLTRPNSSGKAIVSRVHR